MGWFDDALGFVVSPFVGSAKLLGKALDYPARQARQALAREERRRKRLEEEERRRDEQARLAGERERREIMRRRGRASTMLTGPAGLLEAPRIQQSLLGA